MEVVKEKLDPSNSLPSLPEIPPLLSGKWTKDPTSDDLVDTFNRLELEMDLDTSPQRAKAIVDRIKKRSYSIGEVAYAAHEMIDSPETSERIRYQSTSIAVEFRRLTEPIRDLRRRIMHYDPVSESEAKTAIDLDPQLEREHFTVCDAEDVQLRFVIPEGHLTQIIQSHERTEMESTGASDEQPESVSPGKDAGDDQ